MTEETHSPNPGEAPDRDRRGVKLTAVCCADIGDFVLLDPAAKPEDSGKGGDEPFWVRITQIRGTIGPDRIFGGVRLLSGKYVSGMSLKGSMVEFRGEQIRGFLLAGDVRRHNVYCLLIDMLHLLERHKLIQENPNIALRLQYAILAMGRESVAVRPTTKIDEPGGTADPNVA